MRTFEKSLPNLQIWIFREHRLKCKWIFGYQVNANKNVATEFQTMSLKDLNISLQALSFVRITIAVVYQIPPLQMFWLYFS